MVFARIRPSSSPVEKPTDLVVPKRFGEQRTVRAKNLEFLLDWVWDAEDSQLDVYERGVGERVSWVLQGYNATVLAYGQTGSGKTHTMYGPDDVLTDFENSRPEDHGIVPRVCAQLFASMEDSEEQSTFIVHVSYLEVYNDRLRDLLGGRSHLLLRESTKNGLTIEGLTHHLASCPSEVIALVQRGNAHRTVAAMKMNERSSRGHAVLAIQVREVQGNGTERCSKLTLVDLAGMESSKKSYAVSGAPDSPRSAAPRATISLAGSLAAHVSPRTSGCASLAARLSPPSPVALETALSPVALPRAQARQPTRSAARRCGTSTRRCGRSAPSSSDSRPSGRRPRATCPTATRCSHACCRTRSAATASARSSRRCAARRPIMTRPSTRCDSRSAPRRSASPCAPTTSSQTRRRWPRSWRARGASSRRRSSAWPR